MKFKLSFLTLAAATVLAPGLVTAQNTGVNDASIAPGGIFDLSHWNITLPVDSDGDGKVDSVSVKDIQSYSHPDYFYLDAEGRMVFVAPNKGAKTKSTSNTRSELRYMLRGQNTRIKTHDGANNFAVRARIDSDKFGSIGGKMQATLRVDHVAVNAGDPAKKPAYSAVIGQIHAIKYKSTKSGFGFGNEPLKIFYKKWPGHDTGSVFWTYERNLAKNDTNRKDIAYPIWGNMWDNSDDPGEGGIALGQNFSYTVNVHENTMYLTFEADGKETVHYDINLANAVNANGEIDAVDNTYSYGGDSLYFKAGVYNQCTARSDPGFWYPDCGGTGDWETDKANGDYAQVSFSRLVIGDSTAP